MTPIATLRLVARDDCPTCHGTGSRVSDDWEAFAEWATRRGLHGQAREDAVEDYFFEVCSYMAVPAMREDCEDCNGSGATEVEVPASALIDLVLEHVQRPVISRPELDQIVDDLKKSMTSAALKSQGLADGFEASEWLRVCQEAAEALRAIAELRPRRVET